jgi:hypothetical protein
MYRDDVTHAWQSSENDANRSTTLAAAEMSKAGQLAVANAATAAANANAIGALAAKVVGNTSIADLTKAGTGLIDWILG